MLAQVPRRLQCAVRVILGLGCLILQLKVTGITFSGLAVLFTLYTLYGISIWGWKAWEESSSQTLLLLIDTAVLFFVLANADQNLEWLGLSFFVFVLSLSLTANSAESDHEWWPPVLITCFAVVVTNFLVHPPHHLVLLAGVAASGLLASVLAVERQQLRNQRDKAKTESAMYQFQIKTARDTERQRIAEDIHDGPLQTFGSFQMRLEVIRKLMGTNLMEAEQELIQLQEICKDQMLELRAFVRGMRPVEKGGSLNAALRRTIEQFEKESGIPVSFVSTEVVDPDETVAEELLKITREALTNVQKHAEAKRVAVSIGKMDRAIELTIEDDGRGFPFSGKFSLEELDQLRLGPRSIKLRVAELKGSLILESKPGEGSNLKIDV